MVLGLQLARVRKILLDLLSHNYKRLRSIIKPYYKKPEIKEWLWTRDLTRLARCLHIISILSETKVYLFWSRDWLEYA